MINGIEVLNKIEMYQKFPITLIIIIFVFLLISVILTFKDSLKNKIIATLFAICALISLTVGLVINTQYSGIIQYQVTIDDSVSMVEFNEKYEVIDVEGKIWTIVEKENSQNGE